MQNLLNKFSTIKSAKDSYFITLEGVEGCGKSTLISKLSNFLINENYQVVCLREPGGTEFGDKLRQVILGQPTTSPLHPLSEALLFAASRAQLLQEKILNSLQKPRTIVLCDRYIDSSFAYQAFARNLGMETILSLHQFPPLNVWPHFSFYLKISKETSLHRIEKRNQVKDYFEGEKENFIDLVIKGMDQLAQLFSERIIIIPAENSIPEVFSLLSSKLRTLIK